MARDTRSLRRDRRGIAALEFALVAGALMMLILGSFGVGLLVWTSSGLQVTAVLTARCLALGSCPNPATYAVGIAGTWIGANAITAADVTTTASSPCNGTAGTTFGKVAIAAPSWAASLFPTSVQGTITVSACFPSSS